MGVEVTKDLMAQVIKSMGQLVQSDVLIGIPDSADERKAGEPINNATIGYIEEFGSPANNIPARPSLVPGVEEALPRATAVLKAGATKLLSGQMDAGVKSMVAAGLIASSSVKAKINSNIQPALAPATIANRKRRGVTRTNTLVDTGQYRNAVTFVVRKKK